MGLKFYHVITLYIYIYIHNVDMPGKKTITDEKGKKKSSKIHVVKIS